MSRPIKFRMWGFGLKPPRYRMPHELQLFGAQSLGDALDRFTDSSAWAFEQFTGLFDADNHEIYEGDILLDRREGYAVQWDDYSVVVWHANGWRLEGSKQNEFGWIGGHWTKNSRVVGNIHEHSHLLT